MQTRQLGGRPSPVIIAGLILICSCAARADPLERLALRPVLPAATVSSVVYGQGEFVATTSQGTFVTSTDAIHWNNVPSGRSFPLTQIVYGGGVFVAAASATYVFQSTDGLHWSSRSVGSQGAGIVLAYGNGEFVAVRADGRVSVSPDGLQWTTPNPGATGRNLQAIAYGNGRFVGVGTSIWVSTDGVQWTFKNPGKPVSFCSLAFGNGVFVARNDVDRQVWVSRDGESWTQAGANLGVGPIEFAGGQFVSLGYGGEWLSSDGMIWSRVSSGVSSPAYTTGMAYGAGQYVAVGSASSILVSPDVTHWASIGAVGGNEYRTIVYAQGRFLAVGQFAQTSSEGAQPPVLLSPDGVAWTSANTGVQASLSGVAYGDGRFVVVGAGFGSGTSGIGVSEDGNSWSAYTLNLPLTRVAYANGQFLAVGSQGISAASPDGLHWTRIETGTTNRLNDICATEGVAVAVGNNGTLLRMNAGLTWTLADSGTALDLQSVAIGRGRIVAVGNLGTVLSSNDGGATWDSQSLTSALTLRSVTFGNDVFMSAGDQGVILISADGSHWTRLAASTTSPLRSTAYGSGKFLILGNSVELELDLKPGLLSQTFHGQDGLGFSIVGEIGRVYHVQAATRLAMPDWTDLGSVTSSQLVTPFVDPNGGADPARFYRVVSAP